MSNRTGIVILIILFLNVALTFGFEWHYSKPPLRQEINLSESGKLFDIYIPMSQTYDVEIHFSRENKSFESLRNTVGKMRRPDRQGLPLTLNWQLLKNGSVIQSESILSTDLCAWSSNYVSRCFGQLKHSPGKYQFKIQVPEHSSELDQFKTTMSINYNLKFAHTWQTSYMFLGLLFNVFIAPIVGGIIGLILVVRLIRHLTRPSI